MSAMNKQILLKSRPVGEPTADNFELVETAVPTPGPGQFRVKVIYMSLDPYMRGRMGAEKSYAATADLGVPMVGGGVGVVEESNNDQFKVGDYVMCGTGWQSYCLSDGTGVMKLNPDQAPISTGVGVLGMPGLTAYYGLLEIGKPQAGETVVVAAASGAVGSVVGQIARIKGCRSVGIAGSPDKCAFVVDELGFDVCLNYKDADFPEQLAKACPDGIDVYFENVGGKVFEAVLPLLNDDSRVPLCGLISQYNMTELPKGTNMLPALMRAMLTHRILIQGFIISFHFNHLPAFLKDVSGWIKSGKLKYREDIVEGIENAPEAFMGLLKGKNFGKLLVRVADDPTRN
ncbi:NADP-dependent oxidoreductase [uncultured Sneathiella sp.]|uniref:NADP-dependent oxidoreductase n=1 Tax=uncultured Sneathiella sp. TaxID=879315 RepID=UPI002593F194|nr:NADP-dependent oxidoreductase [uncultured Sneathiella sp.]